MNRNKQLIIDIVHLYTPHIITLADIEIVVNIRIFFICLFVSVSVCLCVKIFQGLLIFFPVYIVLHHIWKISGKSSLFCSVETFFWKWNQQLIVDQLCDWLIWFDCLSCFIDSSRTKMRKYLHCSAVYFLWKKVSKAKYLTHFLTFTMFVWFKCLRIEFFFVKLNNLFMSVNVCVWVRYTTMTQDESNWKLKLFVT